MKATTSSAFVETRRKQMRGPALTPEQRSRLIEVLDGVPVLRKAPQRPNPATLQAGQVVRREDGSAWQVMKVGPGSAEVKCLRGKRAGDSEGWSASAAGHIFTTVEQVEAERLAAAQVKAVTSDETRCPNCWGGDGFLDGVDRGRDAACQDHQVSEEAVERAARGAVGRRRAEEDPADVAKVLELRATGMAYHLIEKQMGWPDTRGGRPWRIVKAAGKGKQ